MTQTLPVIADSEPCSCPSCISMCRRPCWPTPNDVRALIGAGEASKLMLDYWIGDFSGSGKSSDLEPVAEGISHGDLRDKLLATHPEKLIEGNTWGDTFWGVCSGKGSNHLGKLLMKIRGELRNA